MRLSDLVMASVSLLFFSCGGSDDAAIDGSSARDSGVNDSSAAGDATSDGSARSADSGTARDDAGVDTDGGRKISSDGCGTTPPHTGNSAATTTDGRGTTRDYEVYLPASYDKTKPLALTFAYHGAGGNSSQSEAFGIQNGAGAADASIFVFPQGVAFQTYGVGWDDTCGGYDMVFFDHMVADIESHYCVDTTRVFAAGFSWGCDQVTALTCCRGDKIRAVSGASCTDEFGKADDPTTYANLACPALGGTGIRFTHDASGGDTAYPAPLFTTTSKLFQTLSGCPSFSGSLTANACHTYAGCTDTFIECPYAALGHATPSGWGGDTWSFFATYH